jgi:hypothetical protein
MNDNQVMKHMKLRILLTLSVALCSFARADIDPLEPKLNEGSFSAAWLTDTQYYTEPSGDVGPFLKMTDWLKRYQQERNILFMVHTGDITNRNTPTQWSRAGECIGVLDNVMPCFLAIGNHDMGPNGKGASRDTSHFNQTFRLADNPLTANSICSVFEAGHLENAAYFFDSGKWHLLVLSLEFATRPEVVDWADKVVSTYPDRKVILITHDYIDYRSMVGRADGMPLRANDDPVEGHAASYPIAKVEKICSAETIWKKLITKHENFILTLNGHYGSESVDANGNVVRDVEYVSSYRIDKTEKGNFVHQIMFNPQFLKDAPAPGGHGWIRLMEFQPDGETIFFRTFSPFYAMDRDDATSSLYAGDTEQFSVNIRTGERGKLK